MAFFWAAPFFFQKNAGKLALPGRSGVAYDLAKYYSWCHQVPAESLLRGGAKQVCSGQIITTSADVTLNCGLVRESPQNPLNSGLGIILICPEWFWSSAMWLKILV